MPKTAVCVAAGVPGDWMDACTLDVALSGSPQAAGAFVGAPPALASFEVQQACLNCGAGNVCCDGVCTSTALDSANCGGCGRALLFLEFTAPWTAPLMTVSRIAAPKRSQKCRLTSPDNPDAAELIGPGRTQGHHDTRRRARLGPQDEDAGTSPARPGRGSRPTSFVPRSSSTTLPSALNVSVAVMQVVMPGSVESIAVSSVQSMKAPLASRNRRVGSTEGMTAGVSGGFQAAPAADRCHRRRAALPLPVRHQGTGSRSAAPAAPAPESVALFANAGPARRRSNASSPGVF